MGVVLVRKVIDFLLSSKVKVVFLASFLQLLYKSINVFCNLQRPQRTVYINFHAKNSSFSRLQLLEFVTNF